MGSRKGSKSWSEKLKEIATQLAECAIEHAITVGRAVVAVIFDILFLVVYVYLIGFLDRFLKNHSLEDGPQQFVIVACKFIAMGSILVPVILFLFKDITILAIRVLDSIKGEWRSISEQHVDSRVADEDIGEHSNAVEDPPSPQESDDAEGGDNNKPVTLLEMITSAKMTAGYEIGWNACILLRRNP